MKQEEYIEMQRRNRELESKMTKEEKEALAHSRRRHARKVRDEILTSYEINEQHRKNKSNDE